MDESFSLETLKEIWNETTGDHIEVGPDRDGLELLEIRIYQKDSHTPLNRMVFTQQEAKLIMIAINELQRGGSYGTYE